MVVHVVGFAIGWAMGAVAAVPIFFSSLVRGARTFHAHGVLCRAEVTALDEVVGPRLAGSALVRLSGATAAPGEGPDILGLAVKWLPNGGLGPRGGDQDLLCATFESFLTARRALRNTRADDYLANRYHAVARWWVRGLGVVPLWVRSESPAERAPAADTSRRARLEADIAAGGAALVLEAGGDSPRPLARIRLVEILPVDARELRLSMFRRRRGLVPVGLLSGIRALVYPASQLGRRLRGG